MAKYSALVIESSKETVALLETVLRELGLGLVVCDSAARAHQLAKNINPNLVILDLDQPLREQVTLLGALRDRGLSPSVLWLTWEPSSLAIERVHASGAQGLIRRDSDATTFKAAIRAVLCGDQYFSPQLTSPATPDAKAIAESQKLLKVLRQTREKQG